PTISTLFPYTTLFRSHHMLVIFRVVSGVERPGAFSVFPMDVPRLVQGLVLTHDQDVRLDHFFPEGGSLSHETTDHPLVALGKHRSEEHTSELQSRENL